MTATRRQYREHLPSPARVRADMLELRILAEQLIELAKIATEGYQELYEASLSPMNVDTGPGELPPGKSEFRVTDPTGDVAVSGAHSRMRGHAHKVANKLRKCRPILEEAEKLVSSAFLETDPEFAEKLLRLREIEAAIRAETEKSA